MQRYPVKERDTLWSIGRQFGVSVDALAKANGLKGRQVHLLRIDQVLLIPDREAKAPKTTLELKFRGLDFSLLTPDRVKVQHDGCTTELSLDANNSLKLAISDHSQGLNVWIENADKQMEQVFSADCVPIGKWALSIDSRMVKAKGELQPARGRHTANTAEVKQGVTHNAALNNGSLAQQQTRVEAGAPVHGLATVYTAENLRLAPSNEKYRALIVAAAKKYDLTPQSLAAMIAAEASKSKTGEWLEESNKAYPDRAQGLCQFFEAGWTAVFGYQKSLLYADTKSLSPTARLKKRLVAKYAIDSIAAYATINLEAFEKQTGLAVRSLPAEEKAKIGYMLHHEGVYGTKRIAGLAGELTQEQWRNRLSSQLDHDDAAVDKILEQYDYDSQVAYRGWFYSLVDTKINVNHFVVTDGNAFAVQPRTTSAIMASLPASAAPAKQPPKGTPPAPKPKQMPKPPVKSPESSTAKPSQQAKSEPPKTVQPQNGAASTGASGTTAQASAKWHDPLAVCKLRTAGLGPTGARFGWTRQGGTKNHQGIDLIAVPGTAIYAVANGTIYTAPSSSPSYAYGNTLILEVGIDDLPPAQAEVFRKVNPNARTIGFFYAHLSELPDKSVKHVSAGEVIGKTGESGNAKGMNTVAKGAHLHFEVRLKPLVKSLGLSNRTDPLAFIENLTNA